STYFDAQNNWLRRRLEVKLPRSQGRAEPHRIFTSLPQAPSDLAGAIALQIAMSARLQLVTITFSLGTSCQSDTQCYCDNVSSRQASKHRQCPYAWFWLKLLLFFEDK